MVFTGSLLFKKTETIVCLRYKNRITSNVALEVRAINYNLLLFIYLFFVDLMHRFVCTIKKCCILYVAQDTICYLELFFCLFENYGKLNLFCCADSKKPAVQLCVVSLQQESSLA